MQQQRAFTRAFPCGQVGQCWAATIGLPLETTNAKDMWFLWWHLLFPSLPLCLSCLSNHLFVYLPLSFSVSPYLSAALPFSLLYVCLFLSLCSVSVSVYLSTYLSVYLVCLSVIYLSVCLSAYVSICLCVCLSVCLPACLPAYLSPCLCLCFNLSCSMCVCVCANCQLPRHGGVFSCNQFSRSSSLLACASISQCMSAYAQPSSGCEAVRVRRAICTFSPLVSGSATILGTLFSSVGLDMVLEPKCVRCSHYSSGICLGSGS